MTDISAAKNLLIAYNEEFAFRDFSPIHDWIEDGADLEHDILPAIRERTEKKKDIQSVQYFEQAVLRFRDERLAREGGKEAAAKVVFWNEEEARARHIALRRKYPNLYVLPRDLEWLAHYEATQGPVAV